MKIAEQPEMTEREKIRTELAAEFMADFESLIGQRLQFISQQCRAHCELPCSPLDTRADPRVNRLVQYLMRELAVMQVLQAKTFARLLDMLELEHERRGKPHGKKRKTAEAEAAEGEPAGSGSDAEGRPEEPTAAGANAAERQADRPSDETDASSHL